MAYLLKNWRVPAALLIAAGLVVGAYLAATSSSYTPLAVASTETELFKVIATKDADGDSLPDWEESLFGTDPHKVDSHGLGVSDGEAVRSGLIVPKAVAEVTVTSSPGSAEDIGLTAPEPNSLTDIFSKNFFSLYLAAKQSVGRELTPEEIAELATNAIERLTEMVHKTPVFKSKEQILVSGSGTEALRTYAAKAEGVFATHTTSFPKSELEYLKEAVDGDTSTLESIEAIATAYRNIATGLVALSVPSEAQDSHLAIINAMAGVGNIASDFARFDTDPLTTMLALVQYKDAVIALGNAFTGLSQTYARANIVFGEGEAGGRIVNALSASPQAP